MSKAFNEDEANRRREEIHQQYLKSQSKIDLIRYQISETINSARRSLHGAEDLCIQLTGSDDNLSKVKLLQQEWYSQTIVFGSQEELKDSERLAAGIQWLPYRLRADAVIAEHAQLRALVRAAHERLISPSFLDLD